MSPIMPLKDLRDGKPSAEKNNINKIKMKFHV